MPCGVWEAGKEGAGGGGSLHAPFVAAVKGRRAGRAPDAAAPRCHRSHLHLRDEQYDVGVLFLCADTGHRSFCF